MSRPLPPEMLDHIADQIRDDPTTLKTWCLASKSWIHRTRKLLFAHISFNTSTWVESWKNAFRDPTNSPAHHTRSLNVITDGWDNDRISLAQLHGLSPALRSLYVFFVSLPDSEIFGLVCSFPLLEDLALVFLDPRRRAWGGEWIPPSTSPRLTGSLELETPFEGIQSITNRLLDLQNGIHFTRIAVQWLSEQDVKSTTDLVSRCTATLQFLEIVNNRSDVFPALSARSIAYRHIQTRPGQLGLTSPK